MVVGVNLMMSLLILPRLDFSFLAQERWGSSSVAGVAGVWSVAVALAANPKGTSRLARIDAEQIRAAQQRKPQPTPPNPAPGSMEWRAAQQKSS